MVRHLSLKLLKLCLFISLANAKVLEGGSAGQFPGSPSLMRRLAEDVCTDVRDFMFLDQASYDACPENFSDVDSEPSLRSEVKVRCRWSAATLKLEAAPCSLWQVVVLVPDKEEEAAMSYTLILPESKYSDMEVTSPLQNFTLYSSVLRAGRASFWQKHETVLAWNQYKSYIPEHKDYNVQLQFVNYTDSEADDKVTGIMSWNHTGDADACFTVSNYCNKLTYINVWPDAKHRAVVSKLPLDRSCRVEVTGLHGTTELHYRTPTRDRHKTTELHYRTPARDLRKDQDANITDVSNNATLQVPKIVYIEAVEDGACWAVRVAWARPSPAPERYSVLLRADAEHVLNVTGNATEAIVRGVTGKGLYNVSLYAYKGKYRAHTFKRAWFIESSTEWRWAGAAGGTWAAVLCLLALALCWLRLRTRRPAEEKPEDQESKPLDDILLSLESGCEDQWDLRSERLTLHEVIGEGAFGKVRRGVLAPAGKEVAVKMLKDFPTADEVRAFRLEMEVMKSVGAHGHVVSLLGCCSGARPLIVQEYCARGDLLRFLRSSWDVMVSKHNAKYYNNNNEVDYRNELFKSKPQRTHSRLAVNKLYELQGVCDADLTLLDLLSFCRQIAKGMEFLAANRLVHRDLAARNVLVTSDRTLKIADFGLSRDVYEENQYRQKGNGMMPVKWMAPESLTRKIYSSQSDVWSFGVVVWEVVTVGGSPYPEVPAARLPRLLRAGYRMPRPVNCSKQLYEVMLSCWQAAPRARPTFAALYRRLDELLQSACADDYLALELEEAPPSPPPPQRLALSYFRMMMGKRAWSRETYERPMKAPQGNHNYYTSMPATLARDPA